MTPPPTPHHTEQLEHKGEARGQRTKRERGGADAKELFAVPAPVSHLAGEREEVGVRGGQCVRSNFMRKICAFEVSLTVTQFTHIVYLRDKISN